MEGPMAEGPKAATDEGEDTTVEELKALVRIPGALRIITNEVKPELREDRDNPASPAGGDADLTNPATFVTHHVTDVAGPDERGRYLATSDEGAWVTGYPDALLARLRQWRHG
jgi:hypothetical protein